LWATVYPIFQAKCDETFCHGSAEFPPNLVGPEATVRPFAEERADKIMMRTAVDALLPMPPAGSANMLTDEDRATIAAWASSL